MIRKMLKNRSIRQPKNQPLSKAQLEKKVVESAKEAVKKYPGIFERLAQYDRV